MKTLISQKPPGHPISASSGAGLFREVEYPGQTLVSNAKSGSPGFLAWTMFASVRIGF